MSEDVIPIGENRPAAGRRSAEDSSRRILAEKHYELVALRALGLGEDVDAGARALDTFGWLVGDPPQRPGGSGRRYYRRSILAALGRIGDGETVRDVARLICGRKPPARTAIAWIRRYHPRTPVPTRGRIVGELAAVIDAYLMRYPSAHAEVLAALEHVRSTMRK